MPHARSFAPILAALAFALSSALLPSPSFADFEEEDPQALQRDPEYAKGKAAVESKDWKTAIKLLNSAALRDTKNPDIQNYLGYAHRNAGNMELAFKHYTRALELSPRHRGAHEYMGEAYLIVNNLPKAEEHLAALKQICLIPCEEYEDLEKKIKAYRQRADK